MTYFFMLMFVFWTLAELSSKLLFNKDSRPMRVVASTAYALLGTFFFYNIW